jgi:hypothetical protein
MIIVSKIMIIMTLTMVLIITQTLHGQQAQKREQTDGNLAGDPYTSPSHAHPRKCTAPYRIVPYITSLLQAL